VKVILCVGWYFPDSVGGSEIYVQRLARELRARGVQAVIAAPYDAAPGRTDIERYEHEGTPVVRYPVPQERDAAQQLGRTPHRAFDAFERVLREERADIFHLHSFSYGANAHHVRAARRLGMRAFLTVHTPTLLCMRVSLRRMGRQVCDGRVDPGQCVACYMHHRGVPERAAYGLAAGLLRLPTNLPALPGRLGTVLSTPALVDARKRDIHDLFADVERVIAVCDWLRVALIKNGADPSHVLMHRQGVDVAPDLPPVAERAPGAPLSIGYFGRADTLKGIEVLIAAVRAVPAHVRVAAQLYVIASSADDKRAFERVRELAHGDDRIAVRTAVAPDRVPQTMREHDIIAVPSLWLETGPLVVMEALALGVPVLGSQLGGIAELVQHGVSGWLVPPGDVAAWRDAIVSLATDPSRVAHAAEQAKRVSMPSSESVAQAMLELYRSA
jgi:glycosyltransferase involved in cell wall biosynthesis